MWLRAFNYHEALLIVVEQYENPTKSWPILEKPSAA
jgi:hypothetical protein